VALDAILERGRLQRRRAVLRWAGAGLAVAALVVGGLLLRPEPPAPVHLRLQLIDTPAAVALEIGGRPVGEWDLLVDGVPGEVEAP
jgi:hypothetical protein